jgi:hypothetical protein
MDQIEKHFKVEDIPLVNKNGDPNLLRELGDMFGIDVVLFLCHRAGGDRHYIMDVDTLLRPARKRFYGEEK